MVIKRKLPVSIRIPTKIDFLKEVEKEKKIWLMKTNDTHFSLTPRLCAKITVGLQHILNCQKARASLKTNRYSDVG